MRIRLSAVLTLALLVLAPTVSLADLTPYSQDFEGLLDTTLDQPAQVELANDGWKIYVNVFGPNWDRWYGYGTYPAPNGGFGGPAFSAVIVGEGGPGQGAQQLSIYSDYNNGNHGDGSNAIIESNVFQEQFIGAADVGRTWRFEFDARRGALEGGSSAAAFFKTLDPAAGYALTNYIPLDMTAVPDMWGRYSLSLYISPDLEGQLLQFGFVNWASNYEGTSVYYDNINLDVAPLAVAFDIKPEGCPNPINSRSEGVLPVAVLGTYELDVNMIDPASLQLEGVAPIRWGQEDVATPFAGAVCGCTAAGPDGLIDLELKFDTQAIIAALGPTPMGEMVLTLTGTLLDGTPIEGQDCVVLVGGGRPALYRAVEGQSADSPTPQDLQHLSGADDGTLTPQSATSRGKGDLLPTASRR